MVTIKKGKRTLTVTMGAYNQLYKALGYLVIGHEGPHNGPSGPGNGKNTPEISPALESDSNPDTEEIDGEEEKPISEMSFRELKDYADRLGINANGVTSKSELRRMIRSKER